MDTAADEEWNAAAKSFIRVEMAKRNMTYADLVEVLAARGIEDNERNVRNKVARGSFSAAFFIQCMVAIGVDVLRFDDRMYPGHHAAQTERDQAKVGWHTPRSMNKFTRQLREARRHEDDDED
jgi:Domain of unknown function (DUF6471)